MEPGYYDAVSARAICAAGKFTLCGMVLQPFCFRHVMQLEALEVAPWSGRAEADLSDFWLAAAICSRADFLTEIPKPSDADLVRFDLEDAWAVWAAYLQLCYFSRPTLWKQQGGSGSHCRAPLEEYVTNFILRNAHGYSREWCMTAPVAEVLWAFESIAEQGGTRSRILTEEDQRKAAAENTPAANRARAKREKIAGEILKLVKDRKEQQALLVDLYAGRLAKGWKKKEALRASGGRRPGVRRSKKGCRG